VADHDSDYVPTGNTSLIDGDSGTYFHRQVGFTAIKALARGGHQLAPTIVGESQGIGHGESSVAVVEGSGDMAGQVVIEVDLPPITPFSFGNVMIAFAKPYVRRPLVFAMLSDGTGSLGAASLRMTNVTRTSFRLSWTNAPLRRDHTYFISYFVVGT
jgi:hypothetical protein